MAKPIRNSLGPLLLHHGCDRSLANLVLEGKTSPIPSENKYDWLGPGIYFWVDSPSRAMTWAREKYNRETGSNLKAPQPKGGPRKRSFCARMSGVKGPMKDEKGRPTRKALALRKWKC